MGRVMMSAKAELNAVRVGMGEADHVVGSWRCGRRSGSVRRAGRESMTEATKAIGARMVGSGRPMPPVDAERETWKDVRSGVWSSRR